MDAMMKDCVEVFISDDGMSAEIFLADMGDGDLYDTGDILSALENKDVKVGIDIKEIEDAIKNKKYRKLMCVARGIEKKDGRDGYYDFKFNTSKSKKPKLLKDGSVDYLNLNFIQSVCQGDVLAEYVEKTDGENGVKVTGEIIPARVSKDLPPLRGKGFYVSEDGKTYMAAMDGKVELNMGKLIVSKSYVITGDVDISVGNVDFRGDLEIMGSIRAGLTVKATGTITVNKMVEAACVEAGGDIIVKGGILGGSKAVISADGDIFAAFIENATVSCNGSIQADSIVNCSVKAYSDINIYGKTSCIVGGELKANRYIRTKKIGSSSCVLTKLEVGIEQQAVNTYKTMVIELAEQQKELEKIERAIELLNKKEDAPAQLKMQMIRTKIERSAEISTKKNICDSLRSRIEIGKNAEIVAEERVYPGVHINIDGYNEQVEEEYTSTVFKRKGDKILTTRFSENGYNSDGN